MLLYFGYTFCPDVSPADLVTLKALLDEHGEQVQVVFITLDPERDTPRARGVLLPHFDARIVGLTGTAREIGTSRTATEAYYVQRRRSGTGAYLVDHSPAIYLLDHEGRFRGAFPRSELGADAQRAEGFSLAGPSAGRARRSCG